MDWLTGSRQGEIKKLVSRLGDPAGREEAARELIRRNVESLPILLDGLQAPSPDFLPVSQEVLARIPSATPALINLLRTAHPIVRARVVEIFIISKDKSAMPALLDALKGEFFTVRSRAAIALARMGDPLVIPSLLPLLKDPEDEVRMAACAALGEFRVPSTFDEITNVLLDDPKIEVRQAAARALGDTRHPAAVPFLMEALRDPFWWYEREDAASALLTAIGDLGAAAVKPLIGALEDKEGTVRKFAASLLGKLRDPRAVDGLGMAIYDLHHDVSRAAAESLAEFGVSAIEILIQSARHPEPDIRVNSALALGRIKDDRVYALLTGMINDPDRSVRKQVLFSLGELHDRRAVPVLQEIASDRADREISSLAKDLLLKIQGSAD